MGNSQSQDKIAYEEAEYFTSYNNISASLTLPDNIKRALASGKTILLYRGKSGSFYFSQAQSNDQNDIDLRFDFVAFPYVSTTRNYIKFSLYPLPKTQALKPGLYLAINKRILESRQYRDLISVE